MTNPTVLAAIHTPHLVDKDRNHAIPPPNYDIAIMIHEDNGDGTDTETPFISFGRPQDFATNNHIKYTRFGILKHFMKDEEHHAACFLVHLYWDGQRDEESAISIVRNNASRLSYGQWRPTAPSDPLMDDDFWPDSLALPPNGYWEDYEELSDFQPFDNFARPPYKAVNFTPPPPSNKRKSGEES